MSLQLIIAPVAFAAGTDLPGAEAPKPPSAAQLDGAAGDAHYETGMGSEGGYDFWLKQVMILGLSVVGANIMTSCYTGMTKISMIGYMLGSVTYVLSEIFGAEAENQRHKKNMSDLAMDENKMAKEGTEMQKKALQKKRDDEQASLDYIINKRNWMIAITAIYTAAMAAAIVEEILAVTSTVAGGYDKISKANCKAVGGPEVFGIKILSMAIMVAWGLATSQIDGGGYISQYGGLLIGVLMMFSQTVAKALISMYEFAWQRAITFGAHAALGGVVLGGLVQRQNAAEDNIEKLDRVIKDFTVVEGNGAPEESGPNGAEQDPNKLKNGKVSRLAKGVKPNAKCMNAKREVSTAACGNPLKFNKPKTNFSGDLGMLDTALGHSVDMANSAASGNMAKANASAAELGNMAGKLKALTEKLKKKHNALLKSKGKKPIDYEKEIKKSLANTQGMFNQVAAAKGFSPGTVSNATIDFDAIKKDDGPKGQEAAKTEGAAAEAAPDLGLEEEGITESEPEKIAQSGEGIENFETNEQDISKASDVPIWTQLSNRYILNYTKIFDKKKEETEPVAEAPAPAPEVDSVKK